MREIFKSGSVGRAPGNRCLYPEADSQLRRCALRMPAADVRRFARGSDVNRINNLSEKEEVIPMNYD